MVVKKAKCGKCCEPCEFFGICPHSYHEFDLKFKEARMTNEEAIKSLESVRYLRKVCTEDIDAITLAIHALEKQVPRPVKVYKASPNHIIMCPSCWSTFVARNNVVMNHCNNCGQAVELVDEKGEE